MSEDQATGEKATDGPTTVVSADTLANQEAPTTGGSQTKQRTDPPPPPPQTAFQPRIATKLDPRWFVGAAAAGVATDAALRRVPWNSAATGLLVTVTALALAFSGLTKTRSSRLLLASAVFFGAFLAVRTEPILGMFNIMASGLLLALGAVHGQGRPFWNTPFRRWFSDAAITAFESINGLVEVPAESAAQFAELKRKADSGSGETALGILRGLTIAVPLVIVLGLLLASADVVFESYFSGFNGLSFGGALGHVLLIAIGAYAMMILLRLAYRGGSTNDLPKTPSLGAIESGLILGLMTILFMAFAVAQAMTVLGGADQALAKAGLTSKEFARQGFFQLLFVAGITLVVLITLWATSANGKAARRVVRLVAPATATFVGVIVVVAVVRIMFYIDLDGLTPLRLYSSAFAIWVGLALLLTTIAIQGWRREHAWLAPAILVSGLIALAILNVANPERQVALDNLNRDDDQIFWHLEQGQFTGDGQSVIADGIDRLDGDLATRVEEELCTGFRQRSSNINAGDDWLRFNYGRSQSAEALEELCS